MELPPTLRQAIDKALEGVPTAKLAQHMARLSQLYREEKRPAGFHVDSIDAARAYIAARLPATYATGRAALAAAADRRPDFAPRSLLDIGAGPGTLLWAASETWPSIAHADLIEGSAAMRDVGASIVPVSGVSSVMWHGVNAARMSLKLRPADVVTAGYLLNELDAGTVDSLTVDLWKLTADTIVFIEPGTPAGHARILRVRSLLIEDGAHIVAPCAHTLACPLHPPDWCHFSQRVARSRIHRAAKNADVPWEDERFIYLAASRHPAAPSPARVIAPVQQASGHLTLKLCTPLGDAVTKPLSRRDGEAYRTARRLDWGDTFDL